IGTSAEHPFFVKTKGWVDAAQLEPGDLLSTRDGRWVAAEGVTETGELHTLYNLRVEGWHTYFVGDETWQFDVWAHNACVGIDPNGQPVEGNRLLQIGRLLRNRAWLYRLFNPMLSRGRNVVTFMFRQNGQVRHRVFESDGKRGPATGHPDQV